MQLYCAQCTVIAETYRSDATSYEDCRDPLHMSYLPLARKYRPQTFHELIGQPHVSATLTRTLESQRIAQAYLFTGQRGVGKTSAARILAKCLNCTNGPTPTPCQSCPSCVQITQGNSMDVIEIDGASNRGIDEIRRLRESVPFAPTTGHFRIYIIDEVHMLTTEAFNALLKTLEEPPAHVKFIFATTAANKVPATILSRCQRFDFRRIEAATIVGALKRIAAAEKLKLEEPALYAIARAADGSLRDAEVLLDQLTSFTQGKITESEVTELLGAVESDALITWAQAILERNSAHALTLLTAQLDQGKEPIQLLTALARHMRNLLILRSTEAAPSREVILTRLVDEPAERLKRLEEQAKSHGAQELLLISQVLTGAYELVRRSPMAHTILELVVIKLATREQWQSLDEISRRLEQLGSSRPAAASTLTSPTRLVPPSPAAHYNPQRVFEPPHSTKTSEPLHASGEALQTTEGSQEPPTTAPEQIVTVWAIFLERLGAQKMSLAAYLADSRPVRFEAGTLTIGLPGFALHQEVLSHGDNKRLIDRLLTELFQTQVSVQYATIEESVRAPQAPAVAAPTVQASMPPVVQEIVNLFNATILNKSQSTS